LGEGLKQIPACGAAAHTGYYNLVYIGGKKRQGPGSSQFESPFTLLGESSGQADHTFCVNPTPGSGIVKHGWFHLAAT
jgi:hypothetical protein